MTEEEDPFEHTRMSLGEHLNELRSRLVRGLLAVGLAFFACWAVRDDIQGLVLRPYHRSTTMLEEHYVERAQEILAADPERARTEFFVSDDPSDLRLRNFDPRAQGIRPGEHFFFTLKICLYCAIFLGAPVLLWQLWQFIAAGLYRGERRAIAGYFPLSVGLFLVGVGFGYFLMVPYALYFLNRDAPIELIDIQITLEGYLTFISSLCLAFGGVFQLPLVMSFLGGAGVVEPADLARYRGHFIVGAFIVAAILTPPDPFTQLMLGVPMIALYEVGIWAARLAARRRDAVPSVGSGGAT